MFDTPNTVAAACLKHQQKVNRDNDSPNRREPLRRLEDYGCKLESISLEALLRDIKQMGEDEARIRACHEEVDRKEQLQQQQAQGATPTPTPTPTPAPAPSAPSDAPAATPDAPAPPPLSNHKFVWPNVFPTRQLTLLAGPPGVGKSFLMHDLAARISRRGPAPFSTQPPESRRRTVLFFSGEDSMINTITPRLLRMNADIKNIEFIHSVTKSRARTEDPPNLERDMLPFRLKIASDMPALVVIETLPAILRDRPDAIRAAIDWLDRTAFECKCAIVAILHTKPGKAQHEYHHLVGNRAYTTAARLIWKLQPARCRGGNPDVGLRHLTLEKCNIPIPDTRFTLALEDNGVNYIHSEELFPVFDSLRRKPNSPALQKAMEFLLTELKDGPKRIAATIRLAKANDIKDSTLKNARRLLGIQGIDPENTTAEPRPQLGRGHWAEIYRWALPIHTQQNSPDADSKTVGA